MASAISAVQYPVGDESGIVSLSIQFYGFVRIQEIKMSNHFLALHTKHLFTPTLIGWMIRTELQLSTSISPDTNIICTVNFGVHCTVSAFLGQEC